jgi:hypothetical protein
MGRILFSLTFATALLALASSEAAAFVYSSFVCQAVGVRSVDWGRSFFVGEAKMIALSRCARRSGICTMCREDRRKRRRRRGPRRRGSVTLQPKPLASACMCSCFPPAPP